MLTKTCETTEKKSFMVRGSSTVKADDGTTTTVCTFSTAFDKVNGTLPDSSIVSITQTVLNSKLYKENKTQCRADYTEFADYVDALIDGTAEE